MTLAASLPRMVMARLVILASLGGGLEFYDFVTYGIFAEYLAPIFFPADRGVSSLVSTFVVFAGGYLIRPLGGIAFSHVGDRFGRRTSFLVSLLGMSLATTAMALCPSHDVWGLWGTATFVFLRLLQGFCLGGELPGAITYLSETAPTGRAGFGCGILFACASLGVVMASGVSAGLHAALPPAAMARYGWRIAFGLGGLFGILSFLPRSVLVESPVFARLRQQQEVARAPLLRVLRENLGAIAACIGVTTVVAGFNGILFAFLPTYLVRVAGYSSGEVSTAILAGLSAGVPALIASGALSDRFPPQTILRLGAATVLLLSWPFFHAVSRHGTANLILWLACLGAAGGIAGGAFGIVLAGSFQANVRFSGVALSYNVGFALFSGSAPVAAAGLVAAMGNAAAPAVYLAGVAVTALVASLWSGNFPDTKRVS